METREEPVFPQVILFVTVRTVINAAYRMIYPFLRVFASGMGVPLEMAALPLTGRSVIGMLGPLLAPVADRYGRKTGMLFGLALFSLGVGVVAAWPSFPAFFAALVLSNLGNQMFLPAMQAYLGDRVPYQQRGRVLAITEMSWSLSFILLVPLAGLLISKQGWTSPFWIMLALGITGLALIAWRLPSDRPPRETLSGAGSKQRALWHSLRQVITNPAALTALSVSMTITVANEVVNLVFGVWVGDTFHLEIAALGLAATVIGVAELSGEAATAALVDRIGKKRAVRAGIIFTGVAALLLPFLGQTLTGALVGLFLFYLGFEFAIVSYIPLMTEVLPEARATLMAVNLAAFSLGRALGALAGPWLYEAGIGANTLAALAFNGLALLALSRVRVEEGSGTQAILADPPNPRQEQ